MNSERQVSEKKPNYYSNGVLLGNWVEERIGKYKKHSYKHITLYDQDFLPKIAVDKKENDESRNDILFKSQYKDNISPPSVTVTDDAPNYYDNFATTYDLSFQYFPEWIPGTINRQMRFRLLKYEPTDEYLNGFGNLSSRCGLTKDKKEEWECDLLDPRRSVPSTTKTDFIRYSTEAYKESTWPRLHPTKVKCGLATDWVHKPLPPSHPRSLEGGRNPIIWEGHGYGEEVAAQSCVCKI